MTIRKLNLEDFKENQLSRQQTAHITACGPPVVQIEVDEDGNPVRTNTNGDIKDAPIVVP